MSMIQMNEHEQWEAIKAWWKANGTWFIIVVIVAMGLSWGYRYWQQSRTQKAVDASVLYDQLLIDSLSLQSQDLTAKVANNLEKNYIHTPYAALAGLIEAKMAVEKNDLSLAQQKLQWVISHAKSVHLRQIARLRMARVLLALKQPQQAFNVLKVVDDSAFMAEINLVKAEIFVAQNNNIEARSAYEAALKVTPPSEPIYGYIQTQMAQL